MPDEVLDQRNAVARGDAVTAMPSLLDVTSGDGENVTIPLPSGESHPGVFFIIRGMGTSIHPNRAVLFVRADVLPDCEQLLCLRIALFPEAHHHRAAMDVSGGVHLALMLGQCEPRRVPAQSPLASRVVDGNAEVIDQGG